MLCHQCFNRVCDHFDSYNSRSFNQRPIKDILIKSTWIGSGNPLFQLSSQCYTVLLNKLPQLVQVVSLNPRCDHIQDMMFVYNMSSLIWLFMSLIFMQWCVSNCQHFWLMIWQRVSASQWSVHVHSQPVDSLKQFCHWAVLLLALAKHSRSKLFLIGCSTLQSKCGWPV